MSVGNVSVRVPNPGTVQDRNVMAVRQPGFLDAYRDGVAAARAACCASGGRQYFSPCGAALLQVHDSWPQY